MVLIHNDFFFNLKNFYLILALLGLHHWEGFFSICGKQELLSKLQCVGFSLQRLILLQSSGSRAPGLSNWGSWGSTAGTVA